MEDHRQVTLTHFCEHQRLYDHNELTNLLLPTHKQEILSVEKAVDGTVTSRSLMGVRYVPLTTPQKQLARR